MKSNIRLVTFFKLHIFVLYTSLLVQCTLIKNVRALYSEEVKYEDYSNGKKQLRFVGMHHFGKKVFYDEVRKLVLASKQEGYVLFYESMGLNKGSDLEKRKIRKLMGFVPSPEGYKKFGEKFDPDKFMVQNDSLFLNLVNSQDFNVDIGPKQFVGEFEKLFGEIILNETDWNMPIDQEIEPAYNRSQVQEIVLHFRNRYLANQIASSEHQKILVLYGENHQKGLFSELKAMDEAWGKGEMIGSQR